MMLTEEECRKKENEDGKLLLTRDEWIKRSNRSASNVLGRGRGNRDKSHLKCFSCGIPGHFIADCRKPRRQREQKQEVNIASIEDDEPALLLAKHEDVNKVLLNENEVSPKLMAIDREKQRESNVWYLDNGASNHMSGDKSKFSTLDEEISGKVRFGDGSTIKIEGKGSINFRCKNGEERTLRDVYHIPTLCNNIISIGQRSN